MSSILPPSRAPVGRQVKACNACRSLKIKCKVVEDGQPCERCRLKDIDCRVENTQAAWEEAAKWRNTTDDRVSQLQTAVNILLRMSDLPPLSSYQAEGPVAQDPQDHDSHMGETTIENDAPLPAVPISRPVTPVNADKIYNLPIDFLYEVTRLPSLRSGDSPINRAVPPSRDLIARNVITEATAQQLFNRFVTRLDGFIYGIMCPHDGLASLRASSPLLTAAVCAVSALHDPDAGQIFKACHDEFLRLISVAMFAPSLSSDDIRAYIIGSYWLPNISYTLVSHAIRAATAMNYHLAYFDAIRGDEEQIHRARLWYVLYILDHHSSILYGRPAIISPTEEPHQEWETFIRCLGNCEPDIRMSSQIALYHITSKVKQVLGTYSTPAVPEHFLQQMRGYFSELDRWYMVWGNRMPRNGQVGNFPRDGAVLHYHFARLHLCSYIFRGMSKASVSTASVQIREFASLAVASATSVLQLIIERKDLHAALVGMPIYFHGMINFAAVFLIKAAGSDFSGLAKVDGEQVSALVQRAIAELRSHRAAPQHLVYHLSNGLESLCRSPAGKAPDGTGLAGDGMVADLGTQQSPRWATAGMEDVFVMETFDLFQYPMEEANVLDPGSVRSNQYYQ